MSDVRIMCDNCKALRKPEQVALAALAGQTFCVTCLTKALEKVGASVVDEDDE